MRLQSFAAHDIALFPSRASDFRSLSFFPFPQGVTETMAGRAGVGMPASRDERDLIMQFWSTHLARKQVEGLHEVMNGITPVV